MTEYKVMHKPRVDLNANVVVTMYLCGCINLVKLANHMTAHAAVSSRYRRAQRLIAEANLSTVNLTMLY